MINPAEAFITSAIVGGVVIFLIIVILSRRRYTKPVYEALSKELAEFPEEFRAKASESVRDNKNFLVNSCHPHIYESLQPGFGFATDTTQSYTVLNFRKVLKESILLLERTLRTNNVLYGVNSSESSAQYLKRIQSLSIGTISEKHIDIYSSGLEKALYSNDVITEQEFKEAYKSFVAIRNVIREGD
ncbi:hypothetical protein PCE1_000433 [Barthelona sp. PCE]